MENPETDISALRKEFGDDIDRLAQDVQNGYSFAKVSFIYDRLRKLGSLHPDAMTIETIYELDMMQSALVVEYARIFVGGARKISEKKVPSGLRAVHKSIMELRNKRYAHNDGHESVVNYLELQIVDDQIVVDTKANIGIALGAPAEWQALITWLGEYLFDQRERQLQYLSDKTGYAWLQRLDSTSI